MYSSMTTQEYEKHLKTILKKRSTEFTGNVNRESATVRVRTENDTFWKPSLSLCTATEDGRTVIRGVFGPTSAVWTFFMFLYFILAILWMVFITLWFVGRQIKSSDYGWCLGASCIVLLFIGATYLTARIGRMKAKNEMQLLRNFAEESNLSHETH